jgi:hypothetical protein
LNEGDAAADPQGQAPALAAQEREDEREGEGGDVGLLDLPAGFLQQLAHAGEGVEVEGLLFQDAAVVEGESAEQDAQARLDVDHVGQGHGQEPAFDEVFLQAGEDASAGSTRNCRVSAARMRSYFSSSGRVVELIEVVPEGAPEQGAGFGDGARVAVDAVEDDAVLGEGGGDGGAAEAEIEGGDAMEIHVAQAAQDEGVGGIGVVELAGFDEGARGDVVAVQADEAPAVQAEQQGAAEAVEAVGDAVDVADFIAVAGGDGHFADAASACRAWKRMWVSKCHSLLFSQSGMRRRKRVL